MAFTGLQLLHAGGRVGGDHKDQSIYFGYTIPIIGICSKANCGVHLIVDKAERSCTDRLMVEIFALTSFLQLLGIFSRHDRTEIQSELCQQGSIGLVEHEFDRMVVNLDDFLDNRRHVHRVEHFPASTNEIIVPRMLLIELAIIGEKDVVCVEIAGWSKTICGVEFHALTQFQRIFEIIIGYDPALSQTWNHIRCTAFELGQTIINRLGRGIPCAVGGVECGVKAFR
ncbi:hypothetical protein FQZ97_806150 [compost metagenome]